MALNKCRYNPFKNTERWFLGFLSIYHYIMKSVIEFQTMEFQIKISMFDRVLQKWSWKDHRLYHLEFNNFKSEN